MTKKKNVNISEDMFFGGIYKIKCLDHHSSTKEIPTIKDNGTWDFNFDLCVLETFGRLLKITEHEIYIINSKIYCNDIRNADIFCIVKSTVVEAINLESGLNETKIIKNTKEWR